MVLMDFAISPDRRIWLTADRADNASARRPNCETLVNTAASSGSMIIECHWPAVMPMLAGISTLNCRRFAVLTLIEVSMAASAHWTDLSTNLSAGAGSPLAKRDGA